MKYGSVCSGIEAASVAWESLGWKAAWFSEIEAFPSAVLAQRWPEVSNLGDMTKIADVVRAGSVEAPDVLVGGTPCQAFSVAGLRNGLSDARGQLPLSYVELANAIDDKRRERGEEETIFVWENVPGVLSSKDNAFGCFIGALAGESCELQPAGGKWPNAGCVYGPSRIVAWRVLDAQFFGVAQRRKRVFVVASAREGFDPAAVLFEFESVRRDTPPRREPQSTVAALTASGVGTCGADDNQGQAGHLIAQCASGDISHTLKAEGFDGSEDGTGRGTPVIAFSGGNTSGNIDVAACLTAKGQRLDFDVETFAVHGTQDPDTNRELAHTLGRNHGQENACIAFSYKDHGADATVDMAPTLRAGNHDKSHANSGQPTAIAYEPFTLAIRGRAEGSTVEVRNDGTANALLTPNGGRAGMGVGAIGWGTQVRRLTPHECERLQGFPDNHTLINWRGKEAADCPDGPRYRAIGNSMAVPVMRWIGERIQKEIDAVQHNEASAGKYRLIYADPPWQYGNTVSNGAAGNHYSTMSITDLKRLPVWDLADENAVLAMWYTGTHNEEARALAEAWGFTIRTMKGFTWVKFNQRAEQRINAALEEGQVCDFYDFLDLLNAESRMNGGNHTRANTEDVLIATRGTGIERASASVKQVVYSCLGEHSEKPWEVRNRLEKLYGDVTRIELFARSVAEGWDVWGNECDSSVRLLIGRVA